MPFAFGNALTLREELAVQADGALAVSGDIGKLPMLLSALTERGIYACGIAEHRRKGDVIEELHDGWTFIRTCTVATAGPDYCPGVGILLSPEATRQWRSHGCVANQASGWNVSVELPLPGGTVAVLHSFRWPPLGRAKAERERRAAAMRETQGMVAGIGAASRWQVDVTEHILRRAQRAGKKIDVTEHIFRRAQRAENFFEVFYQK